MCDRVWNRTFPVVSEFCRCPKVEDKDGKYSHFLKRDVRPYIWNILTDGQAGPVTTTPDSLQEKRQEKPMPGSQAGWGMGDGQVGTESIGGGNLPLTTRLSKDVASVKDLSKN